MEEVKKAIADYAQRAIEKLKKGQELTVTDAVFLLLFYQMSQFQEYFDKWLRELENNLREEIRKRSEESIQHDEKIKSELIQNDEKIKSELMQSNEKTKNEVIQYVEKVKNELIQNDERIKNELLQNDEKIKNELLQNDERTKNELLQNDERIKNEVIQYVEKVKNELLQNDEKIKNELLQNDERIKKELQSHIEATRSDVGLVVETMFVDKLVNKLSGEKVINVIRHYETPIGEVDAVIETEKRVYVVEVKMKAEVKDVDDLLSKAKEVGKDFSGKEVVPVLTGIKIGKVVAGYARGMKVEVMY